MTGPERTPDGASRASVWLDDAPVDPAWSAPDEPDRSAPEEPDVRPGRVRRRLLTVGIPVLAVIVLIGSVWALGGFDDRDDTLTKVAAGKPFSNGPYEFSFSRATVQETQGYGKYKRIQKVVVTGTIRNVGDQADSPIGDWFVARGLHSSQVETGQSAMIGDPDQVNGPEDVTPGLPAVPVSVDFEFPPTFDDKTLVFGVGELSYGTHSYYSGDDNQFWDTGSGNVFRLQLPISRLAPES